MHSPQGGLRQGQPLLLLLDPHHRAAGRARGIGQGDGWGRRCGAPQVGRRSQNGTASAVRSTGLRRGRASIGPAGTGAALPSTQTALDLYLVFRGPADGTAHEEGVSGNLFAEGDHPAIAGARDSSRVVLHKHVDPEAPLCLDENPSARIDHEEVLIGLVLDLVNTGLALGGHANAVAILPRLCVGLKGKGEAEKKEARTEKPGTAKGGGHGGVWVGRRERRDGCICTRVLVGSGLAGVGASSPHFWAKGGVPEAPSPP